jgi:hypothetical protein
LWGFLGGLVGWLGWGGGLGGEMTQALYAHMNKKKPNKQINLSLIH